MKSANRLRQPGLLVAALALVTVTACSVTVEASLDEPADSPKSSKSEKRADGDAPSAPKKPQAAATPKVFGTAFQTGPDRDWSKGQPQPFEGVLRGWITSVAQDGTAEYKPVRFTQSDGNDGHFEGPEEGDVTRFAAPIAANVKFLSAFGCDGNDTTYDKNTNLGTASCPRQFLIDSANEAAKLAAAGDTGVRPALITTVNGKIVRVVDIYWQGGGG
ncbi:hypothetical protein [Rhizohabitans arisaemae]|uniref:hypothetical protein n=1 Tax=Rhizohabitans arisaemae TaxID=2720610 RepID=UPI0024B0AF08|nr:hypothetical protein [Rhizohabitans arisaemae]